VAAPLPRVDVGIDHQSFRKSNHMSTINGNSPANYTPLKTKFGGRKTPDSHLSSKIKGWEDR